MGIRQPYLATIGIPVAGIMLLLLISYLPKRSNPPPVSTSNTQTGTQENVHFNFFEQAAPQSTGQGCPVPDHSAIVRKIPRNTRNKGGPQSEWVDKVVAKLRNVDKRWGYTCQRGNCNDIATNSVTYWCGKGHPGKSANVTTIGITEQNERVTWKTITPVRTIANQGPFATWIYPRFGQGSSDGARPIIGECGPAKNTCASGHLSFLPMDTNSAYLWSCQDIPRHQQSDSYPEEQGRSDWTCEMRLERDRRYMKLPVDHPDYENRGAVWCCQPKAQ